MKKSILATFMAVVAFVLTSCSSDPWVGTWVADNDTSGNTLMNIESDGTIILTTNADDGSCSIEGHWTKDEGKENTINIQFDKNSISLNFANPFTAAIMQNVLQITSEKMVLLIVSDDGEFLHAPGETQGFVRY